MIVAHKSDKAYARQVSAAEGEALAARWGCPFVEASAKTGRNVSAAFEAALLEMGYQTSLLSFVHNQQRERAATDPLPHHHHHQPASTSARSAGCVVS
jgi:hypothetical protein